jgi:hypothetical protein
MTVYLGTQRNDKALDSGDSANIDTKKRIASMRRVKQSENGRLNNESAFNLSNKVKH